MWIRSRDGKKLVNTDRMVAIMAVEGFDQKESRTKYAITAFSDSDSYDLEVYNDSVSTLDTISDIFLAIQHQCDTCDIF